ncbi:hypothetical protein Pmani_031219 [Petrolisthes manimaculis]|uniref:Uncharacterized protein n=1 Tax=Petrolisthes manimaculis TaxID=1843537 RepID=A0AAE1TSV3_9EUCA|nr:hypothetical protein Pmani_031219 [Petrolisthes manimaculis]
MARRVNETDMKDGQVREDYVKDCQVREDYVKDGQVREDYVKDGQVREDYVKDGKVADAGGSLDAECRLSLGTHKKSIFKTLRVRRRMISYVDNYQSSGNKRDRKHLKLWSSDILPLPHSSSSFPSFSCLLTLPPLSLPSPVSFLFFLLPFLLLSPHSSSSFPSSSCLLTLPAGAS